MSDAESSDPDVDAEATSDLLDVDARVETIQTERGEIEVLTNIALVDREQVRPYTNNPKEHPDIQVGKIASSIDEFRWDQPIVVDETGEIVKGHGRYLSAQKLGIEKVPVVVNRYESESEKRAARLADNRVAESDWDDDLLSSEVSRLADADFRLGTTGFDDDEIDDLLDSADDDPDVDVPDGEIQGPEAQDGFVLATLQVAIDDWEDVKDHVRQLADEYEIEYEVA